MTNLTIFHLFSLWPYISTALVAFYATVVYHRLFLHPLAKFPGPKLAAATRWYECYYDVLCGRYTWKIAELHQRYGPIIRISPEELHINDPSFYEKLYRQDGRWDKYAWSNDAFGVPFSAICCLGHDLHKKRRVPLERYMSRANVIRNQGTIQTLASKLCHRLREFEGQSEAVNLSSAISAFVRDVATQSLLGKNYDNLGKEDFNSAMTNVFQGAGHVWRTTKHFRWFGPLMKSIPVSLMEKTGDEGVINFFKFLNDTLEVTKESVSAFAKFPAANEAAEERSMIQAIMQSNLPKSEKTVMRVFDEVSTVTGAAFETTAAAMRLVLYYVYSNPVILNKLRSELASKSPQMPERSDNRFTALEQLPYLSAVITEGLRLSPGVATRLARIAPDRELHYKEWQIPKGTPVGMTTLLMHMNGDLYPEPKRFEPERWMHTGARKDAEKTYAPFSRGTRNCLGMQ
ncbi:hypothetical protein M426DRAFT_55658 [Hypoxylon sp. CI-4A]|nr:hypothetical protein M426DRAFT_55658 [Hypoxylon sp. CI-4A]